MLERIKQYTKQCINIALLLSLLSPCLATELPDIMQIHALAKKREFNQIVSILDPLFLQSSANNDIDENLTEFLYYYLDAVWSAQNGVTDKHLLLAEQLLLHTQSKSPENSLDLAKAVKVRGHIKQFLADYQGALADFKTVAELRSNNPDIPATQLISALNQVAVLSQELNLINEAQRYYEKAISITKKKLGPDHIYNVALTVNYAMMMNDKGYFEKAVHLYQQAIAKAESSIGFEHQFTLVAYSNLGDTFYSMGDLSRARLFTEKALTGRAKVLGKNTFDYAMSLNNLANIERDSKNYILAKQYYDEVKLITRELVRDNPHFYTARLLRDKALLAKALGQKDEYLSLSKQALAEMEVVYPGGIEIELLITTLQYADALYLNSKYDQALSLTEQVAGMLAQIGQSDNPLLILASIQKLQILLYDKQQDPTPDLDELLSLLDLRFTIDTLETGNSFLYESQQLKKPLGELIAQLFDINSTPTQSLLKSTLQLAHYAQLSAIDWSFNASQFAREKPAYRGLQETARQYRKVQGEYQQLLFNEQQDNNKLNDLADSMVSLLDSLKVDPILVNTSNKPEVNHESVVSSIAVAYFFGERSFRWTNENNTLSWREINLSFEEINGIISTLTAPLKGQPDSVSLIPLYDLTLAKSLGLLLLSDIDLNAYTQLGVVANSVAPLIPWNALVISSETLPSINHFSQFSQYGSVNWLSNKLRVRFVSDITFPLESNIDSKPSLLGIANPDTGSNAYFNNSYLPRLKETEKEVEKLTHIFETERVTRLFSQKATKHNVLAALHSNSYDIISFSTHAVATNSVASSDVIGLALAPDKPGDDISVLTASELANLKLSGSTVILSGCSTAKENHDLQLLETSLIQALLYSNAEQVIATQWPIESHSHTQALTNLLTQQPLHKDVKIKHPLFWAGLVIYQQ